MPRTTVRCSQNAAGKRRLTSIVLYREDGCLSPPDDRTSLGILLDLSPDTKALVDLAKDVLRNFGLLMQLKEGAQLANFKWLWEAICSADDEVFFYGTGFQGGNGIVDLCSLVAAIREPSTEEHVTEILEPSSSFRTGILSAAATAVLYGLGLGALATVAFITGVALAKTDKSNAAESLFRKAREIGDSSTTAAHLTELFKTPMEEVYLSLFSDFFNAPPRMNDAACAILERFRRQTSSRFRHKVLIVISSGKSSDGDPRSTFRSIRETGVIVLTCFVSRAKLSSSKLLYDAKDSSWSEEEQLLWDIASRLSDLPGPLPKAIGPRSNEVALFTRISYQRPFRLFLLSL